MFSFLTPFLRDSYPSTPRDVPDCPLTPLSKVEPLVVDNFRFKTGKVLISGLLLWLLLLCPLVMVLYLMDLALTLYSRWHMVIPSWLSILPSFQDSVFTHPQSSFGSRSQSPIPSFSVSSFSNPLVVHCLTPFPIS